MARKINILQIVRSPVGGIRKHILDIINLGNQEEFQFYFCAQLSEADQGFTASRNASTLPDSRIFDMAIPRSPHLKDLLNIFKLFRYYRDLDIDIIHGHGAKGGLYARILGLLIGARVCYTAHGGSLHSMHGGLGNFLYVIIEKFLARFTDRLIFESQYSMDSFRRKVKNVPKKFVLNYNGVEIFPKDNLPPRKQNFLIGSFGQLRQIKGYDLTILAAAQCKDPTIEIHLYGEGEEEDNLKRLAAKNNVTLSIHHFESDIFQEMKKYDLIIQPSRFESFGYVAAEAMSVSRPILVSEVGGLREIVRDPTYGYSFQCENIDALAEKIRFVRNNPELVQKNVDDSWSYVKDRFGVDRMVETLTRVYRTISMPNY